MRPIWRQVWRNFYLLAAKGEAVGIYHETYLVPAGKYECLYGNMPVYGLAKAGAHVPATGRRETAGQRLGRESQSPEGMASSSGHDPHGPDGHEPVKRPS